jgi:hypothetical protein
VNDSPQSSLILRVAQELHDKPELADIQRRGNLSDDPSYPAISTVANLEQRLAA